MRSTIVLVKLLMGVSCVAGQTVGESATETFDPAKDILSLHYDHAPDKDDGQSAAADRTLLESLYGKDWISKHVTAVSGAYGRNAKDFNPRSDLVMDAAWNDCGGWLSAHTARQKVLVELVTRWSRALQAGGDVWVKEGGQSDITAAVVERIRRKLPAVDTAARIHVVQHADWNEEQTTKAALAYTKKNTHYIRIRDANAYLNVKGGDKAFVRAAIAHPAFSAAWKAAFAYYDPNERLDFSDTGELMHILALGEIGIDDFRKRFLSKQATKTPNHNRACAASAENEPFPTCASRDETMYNRADWAAGDCAGEVSLGRQLLRFPVTCPTVYNLQLPRDAVSSISTSTTRSGDAM